MTTRETQDGPPRVERRESPPPDARHASDETRSVARELEIRTRQLARSEARFRDVIQRNADAIFVVGADGAVRFANGAAEH